MVIETFAKVNLTLEMIGRRPDGYHELATVFQAIDLADRITLRPSKRLEVTVEGAAIPSDGRNLCTRAAELLAEQVGRRPEVSITLEKRIPVGAGLGGGSGNAAGTLRALGRLWDVDLPEWRWVELAAGLGSDVAFFLKGGAAVGRGRGEDLEPLPSLPGHGIVVLGPAEPVSTGAVYRALGSFRDDAGAATEHLAAALREGRVPPLDTWLVNDLEEPACRVTETLRGDRTRLAELAPGRFRLSGSGGSWLLPVELTEAETLRDRVAEGFPGRDVWCCRPVDVGWRLLADAEDTGMMETSAGMLTAGLRAATFLFAIFAALVAAQLYNLIKSSDVAQAWRPFIVGALVFGIWALASFANTFFGFLFEEGETIALVMDVLQALFILLFSMGLWQQRQWFYHPDRLRPLLAAVEEGVADDELAEAEMVAT